MYHSPVFTVVLSGREGLVISIKMIIMILMIRRGRELSLLSHLGIVFVALAACKGF